MRLCAETLDELPDEVMRPAYDRNDQSIGIVHFGLGAFARAHLAAYCDAAMAAGERGWMISGVSLRSASVSDQLEPQNGLYTLTERSGVEAQTCVIGTIREVLVAGDNSERIIERIASADCRIVSFTITEKGYCRDGQGGLDFAAAQAGFYPLLSAGLKRRMEAGLAGVTLLSCDNLPENGRQLSGLFMQWLEREDGALRGWFARHCRCPATMVDRIVPASTDADRKALAARLGQSDEGAVFTERFSQWVVEDDFAGPCPDWQDHGAQIVSEVAPYETAKLRMLNGAHSFLAYVGLAAGHEFVHQAMGDPDIRIAVQHLLEREAAPTIDRANGQDLLAYGDALIQRFDDPALNHRLAQIAMDGSQKIPQRWLATLAQAKRQCPAILTGIAAWMLHIAGGKYLDDPLAQALRQALNAGTIVEAAEALFGETGLVASAYVVSRADIAFIEQAHTELGRLGGKS